MLGWLRSCLITEQGHSNLQKVLHHRADNQYQKTAPHPNLRCALSSAVKTCISECGKITLIYPCKSDVLRTCLYVAPD